MQHTIYDPIIVASLMLSHVQVAEVTTPPTHQDVPSARIFQSQERHSTVTPTDIHRIPSTNPGADPPRDARDSGSARSHSTHLETSSSDRP